MLISIDGVDSSGKETQSVLLAHTLREKGFTVHQFYSPDYNTESGKELKLRLQGSLGDWKNTPWQEKLQYFAQNRAENKEEVEQTLTKGEIVLYDRYVPSSLAFMAIEAAAAGETDIEAVIHEVRRQEHEVYNMPYEDLSIFLDVSPEISSKLLEKRKKMNGDADEYTDELAVQTRLYNQYLDLIAKKAYPCAHIACVEEGNLISIEDIAQRVLTAVASHFQLDI